jgi:hypothetical protein
MSAAVDVGMTESFFQYVHGPAIAAGLAGRIVMSARLPEGSKQRYKSRSYTLCQSADAADAAHRISDAEMNAYCRVHLLDRDLRHTGERGAGIDTKWITHFAADVDIAGPGHKPPEGRELPPDSDTAVALIDSVLPPSVIVSSGGGLYPIWRFSEPIEVDDENRETIRNIGRRLDRALAGQGYHVDPTVLDMARIIRPPGVVNHKPGRDPRPVTMLRGHLYGAGDFTLADLDATLPALPAPELVTPRRTPSPATRTNVVSTDSAPWDVLDELYTIDDILAADPVERWERVNDQGDGAGQMVPAWRRVGSSADYSIKAGSKGAAIVWSSTVAARLGVEPGGGVSRWQLVCAFAGRDPREAARWSR